MKVKLVVEESTSARGNCWRCFGFEIALEEETVIVRSTEELTEMLPFFDGLVGSRAFLESQQGQTEIEFWTASGTGPFQTSTVDHSYLEAFVDEHGLWISVRSTETEPMVRSY